MSDLSTYHAGLKLRNPLIIGSSGLTDSVDKNKAWKGPVAGHRSALYSKNNENESNQLLRKINPLPAIIS